MLKISLGEAWASNTVNTVIFRQHGLLTCGQYQFTAFYANKQTLRVTQRDLASENVSSHDILGTFNIDDAHNSISLGCNHDGFLHIAYDHHETPLRYRRSTSPLDVTSWTDELSMTGEYEAHVTYPSFLSLPTNKSLLFLYRDGSATKGTLRIKQWSEADRRWTDHPQSILSGASQQPWTSNPYWNHPAVDADGSIHLSFVWRTSLLGEERRINNINIDYARSPDMGRTWYSIRNRRFELPITQVNSETVWPVSPGSNLINQTSMAVDSFGNPHIAFYSDDPDGIPQYQHLYFDGRAWKHNYLTRRTEPFVLSGGGTLQIPISRPEIVIDRENRAYVIYRGDLSGDRMIAQRLLPPEYNPDTSDVRVLWDRPLGFSEPIIDRSRWSRDSIISMLVQRNQQPAHDNQLCQPSYEPIYIVDWDLTGLWPERSSSTGLAASAKRQKIEGDDFSKWLQEEVARSRNLAARLEQRDAEARDLIAKLERQETHATEFAAKLEASQANAKELAARLETREAETNELTAKLKKQEVRAADYFAKLKTRERETQKLKNSLILRRAAAPLRGTARGLRWLERSIRPVVKSLRRVGTGRFSRVSKWHSISDFNKTKYADVVRSKTVGRYEPASLVPAAASRSDLRLVHKHLTVAVIAWDVCHNTLSRAHLIAEALSPYFNVVLLGPAFRRFGGRVWEPLEGSDIPVVPLPGEDFPEFAEMADRVAERLGADVVVACKPRLPSLMLGHLLKHKLNRPLFVDIDDYELAFTARKTPVTLDQVVQAGDEERRAPHSDLWTCYSENLLDGVDGFFVSNRELQGRYGGLMVPHARDERLFDPNRCDRQALRTKLGLAADDRVVLFAGTPRAHKGVLEVLAAVNSIPDPRAKMLVVGQLGRALEQKMQQLGGERLLLLGNRPVAELPGYLACADAVCLLQNPDSLISRFQLPAKVADALAFGLPVLATATPPLKPMIEAGVVAETTPDALRDDLQRALLAGEPDKEARLKRREYFLNHLSYAAVGRLMAEAICEASERPTQPSAKILRVREVAASVPSQKAKSGSIDARTDGLDLVLVWKQHDMFLYGRRPEMLVKYLAAHPEVRSILVLEPPISCEELYRWSQEQVTHQGRALYVEWMRKSWGVHDDAKVRTHNFTYSRNRKQEPLTLWRWPTSDEYIDSLADFFARNSVEPSRATFLVYPKNEHIPDIIRRFRPGRVIADIVDDHRTWPNVDEGKTRELTEHYREILGLSDFVIANCEPVRQSMAAFHRDIRVLPNGIDLDVDETYAVGARFKELASLPRPVIGYVGNLDVRIDTDLLRKVAVERPQWQFVLVGSVHTNPKVLELAQLPNVQFPGVVPNEEAKLWIRSFDVAIIPHRRFELTRHMNPLKFYLYLGLGVPVVSTSADNLGELSQHVAIAEDADTFIKAIEEQLKIDKKKTQHELHQHLSNNSWDQRVRKLLAWLKESTEESGTSRRLERRDVSATAPATSAEQDDYYQGGCANCGKFSGFVRKPSESIRESYRCEHCRASARERGQAALLVQLFGEEGAGSLADLVNQLRFQQLSIYEPGIAGPFRKYLTALPNYSQSYYWPDLAPGAERDGIVCQDLMVLTFKNESFDLLITSDIFEHVRRPYEAFREIHRVLKHGGRHIFTVPVLLPMPRATVRRVDTSGIEDRHIEPPHFHGDGRGGKSLVYTDFGGDLLDELRKIGFSTRAVPVASENPSVARVIIFDSIKERI